MQATSNFICIVPTSGVAPDLTVFNRASAYSVGRLPYPEEMFTKIRDIIGKKAKVLDIGCGNGRSTIPLRKFCTTKVTGFDKDPDMLAELSKNSLIAEIKIDIKQGKVEDLSTHFPRKSFDAITAFSSFTLFDDDASIQAIRNVLAPQGVFIDAGDERSKGDFLGLIMRDIFQKTLGKPLIAGHDGRTHNEKEALMRNGFEAIISREFIGIERYTQDQALANFKSRITWPTMNVTEEQKVAIGLADFFKTVVQGDTLHLPVTFKFTVYRQIQLNRL